MVRMAIPPDVEPVVRGRIEVVTEHPIVLPRRDGTRSRVEEAMGRRPWLVSGLLLAIIALLLLRER
jgi:hypothetical protein